MNEQNRIMQRENMMQMDKYEGECSKIQDFYEKELDKVRNELSKS